MRYVPGLGTGSIRSYSNGQINYSANIVYFSGPMSSKVCSRPKIEIDGASVVPCRCENYPYKAETVPRPEKNQRTKNVKAGK